MKAALHLARPEDADRLDTLVAASHAERGIATPDARRRAALAPLLEGSPHGAVYLIGPARAPVGYVVVTFGWSVEYGGLDGYVDHLYIRPPVRRRSIATEILLSLASALSDAGLCALHMRLDRDDGTALRLSQRTGFKPRDHYMWVTRALS